MIPPVSPESSLVGDSGRSYTRHTEEFGQRAPHQPHLNHEQPVHQWDRQSQQSQSRSCCPFTCVSRPSDLTVIQCEVTSSTIQYGVDAWPKRHSGLGRRYASVGVGGCRGLPLAGARYDRGSRVLPKCGRFAVPTSRTPRWGSVSGISSPAPTHPTTRHLRHGNGSDCNHALSCVSLAMSSPGKVRLAPDRSCLPRGGSNGLHRDLVG